PARRAHRALAEAHGGRGRDLPPAALDARRGVPAPHRHAATRGRRCRAARARSVARQAATASAGHRHRRSQAAVRPRDGSAPRLSPVGGRWVAVDHEKLGEMLEEFRKIERAAADDGLSLAEAMRLVAGADVAAGDDARADRDWSQVVAGPWLAETLRGLRSPESLARVDPGEGLQGTLRPYQDVGARWLYLVSELGLGACLADDMGRGKTIQVLALLLVLRRRRAERARPSLLVAPASLLANWAAEAARFAPRLNVLVAHPSAMPTAELKGLAPHPPAAREPWCATRRGESKTRPRSRRARQRSCRPGLASRSRARPSRTASPTCGRSSTS